MEMGGEELTKLRRVWHEIGNKRKMETLVKEQEGPLKYLKGCSVKKGAGYIPNVSKGWKNNNQGCQ